MAEPTHLTPAECWERLRRQQLGRLAYHLTDEVHIVPVNYVVDCERIVLRTSEGSKLLGVVLDADTAFEVDEVDRAGGTAWSVVARGRAKLLQGQDARAADALDLAPWVDGERSVLVAIEVTELSGRVFDLTG